jgi:hypothetical protein
MTADLSKVTETERLGLPLPSKHGLDAGHFELPYVIWPRSHNIYVVRIDNTTVFINLRPVACTNMGPGGLARYPATCLFEDVRWA